MTRMFTTIFLIAISCQLILAQSEELLKRELEGNRVEILIEMPATSEGIDIYPDRPRKMDYDDYSRRIKSAGIALYPGDVVMITKIKKKNKHIEFQLAGGGYGTWGDDSGNVSAQYIPKSSRQEEIEKILQEDKDRKLSNRSALEKELDVLKRERSLAQEDSRRQASLESEVKKSRIQDQRLQAGSRFNIRYDYKVGSEELSVSNVIRALSEFVNFSPGQSSSIRTSPSNGMLQKGMSMEEAIGIMGIPTSLNTSRECGLEISKCTFDNNDQVVEATFAEKVLVKYTVSSK